MNKLVCTRSDAGTKFSKNIFGAFMHVRDCCCAPILQFLPVRRSKRGICYGDMAGLLAGWVSVRHTLVLYQNG